MVNTYKLKNIPSRYWVKTRISGKDKAWKRTKADAIKMAKELTSKTGNEYIIVFEDIIGFSSNKKKDFEKL